MKKFILINLILCLGFVSIFAQAPSYKPSSWYNLYSKAYNQSFTNGDELCKTPSQVKTEISTLGRQSNSIQLVHMICDVEVYSGGQGTDGVGATGGFQNGNGDGDETASIQRTMACGLVIPNNKIFNDDCTVQIELSSFEICSGLTSNGPEDPIRSISIRADGNPVVRNLRQGQPQTISLYDIFQRELTFRVKYRTGASKMFVYDTRTNPRLSYPTQWSDENDDSHLFYPECIGPPIITCPTCPPPPPPPPPAPPVGPPTDDCEIFPHEVIPVIAEIPFTDHLPGGPLYTGADDYENYSTENNESNDDGWDNTNRFGRIDASVYVNPARDEIKKPIIICDGIDFLSSRSANDIMNDGLQSPTLQKLYENDFDVIIADFGGGADFMEKNAFALIELIKQVQDMIGSENDIEAIVGPSMGGQIVRYALLYWESQSSWDPYRIKTFVSADSPWLGANASPAIQVLARIGKDLDSDSAEGLNFIDQMANSPAARQLLVNQVHGLNPTSDHSCWIPTQGTFRWKRHNYDGVEHPFKTAWDNKIQALGSVPQNVKVIAVADGAGNGSGAGVVDPGQPILSYTKDVPILSDPLVNINAITGNGTPLIDIVSGSPVCVVFGALGTNDVRVTSETIADYDSYPGSPFRLGSYISAAGISDITVENTFSFIPTYSALGIPAGANDPDMNFMGDDPDDPSDDVASDFFESYFVDETNSGHNDFLQDGTLEFILGELDTEETELDECWYLEEMAENQGLFCSDEGSDPSISIELYDIEDLNINIGEVLNMDMFDENFNLVEPQFSGFTVMEDGCAGDLDISYSNSTGFYAEYEPTNDEWEHGIDCTNEVEVCFNSPICPDVEVCETISVYIEVFPEEYREINPEIGKGSSDESDFVFNIYPNPSTGQITAKLGSGQNQISIYRTDGRLISNQNLDSSITEFKTELETGVYFIKAYNVESNVMSVEKVIIIEE